MGYRGEGAATPPWVVRIDYNRRRLANSSSLKRSGSDGFNDERWLASWARSELTRLTFTYHLNIGTLASRAHDLISSLTISPLTHLTPLDLANSPSHRLPHRPAPTRGISGPAPAGGRDPHLATGNGRQRLG